MRTHLRRAHPDHTIVHTIEDLSQEGEELNTTEAPGDGDITLANTDDVMAAATAGPIGAETDEAQYDLQLYNI